MDLSLTEEQLALKASFAELFEKYASPERVRAAEARGHDAELWQVLVRAGAPTMGVSEELGGGGASTADLVVGVMEGGRRLAPAPLVEVLSAAAALADLSAGQEILEDVAEGRAIAVLAPRPLRSGSAGPVVGAGVADIVIVLDGDELVALRRPDGVTIPLMANVGSAALAEVATDLWGQRIVLAVGTEAHDRFDDALSLQRVLLAAALEGLRQEALRLAVDYVKERYAFGVPLGWFQSIQHRLADLAAAGEGAELLVHEAAWARDTGDERAATLARMAILFSAESAFDTASSSLHFHGGYGFTLEYDIQMYYRRAKAWPLALGAKRFQLRELAADCFRADQEVVA